MSIFLTNDTATQQQIFAASHKLAINNMVAYLQTKQQGFMDAHWYSDQGGLTVQQKFDSYGTDAGQLFALSSALSAFISSIDPTYVPVSPMTYGYTYVINSDGTVTVTPIPAPAPTPDPTDDSQSQD